MRTFSGWQAVAIAWALSTVPAGFCVYIIRTVFTERLPEYAAGVVTLPATIALWLAFSLLITAWAIGGPERR